MKKKLEADLVSIAHRILQLKDGDDIKRLQEEARKLYEKLTVLNFVEGQLSESMASFDQKNNEELMRIEDSNNEELSKKETQKIKPIIELGESEIAQEASESAIHIEKDIKEKEVIKPELVIEEINEKVSEDLFVPKPPNFEQLIKPSDYRKNDKLDIGGQAESLPKIDITDTETEEKPKSLNDQLKKGIQIGLNDRLAFIKHLFEGSTSDYNRVLSQLNTLNSKSGARQFIKNMVKPDYKNWEGKEEYEERFIEIVTSRYDY